MKNICCPPLVVSLLSEIFFIAQRYYAVAVDQHTGVLKALLTHLQLRWTHHGISASISISSSSSPVQPMIRLISFDSSQNENWMP